MSKSRSLRPKMTSKVRYNVEMNIKKHVMRSNSSSCLKKVKKFAMISKTYHDVNKFVMTSRSSS